MKSPENILSVSAGTRLTGLEKADVAAVAAEMGVSPAAALRIAAVMLVETHRSKTMPALPVQTDKEALRAWWNDFGVYRAVADAILETRFKLNNNQHREAIAAEVATDRALVSVIAKCVALDATSAANDLLGAVIAEWLEQNPGAEFAELPREDVVWLALNFGDRPSIPQQHVTYLTAEADRAMVVDRWRWHRRLLKELVARGINYKELFHDCPEWGGPRLVAKPRLRAFSHGGQLEYAIGKPTDIVPPQPAMSEAEAATRGITSRGSIGGTQPAGKAPTRIRRGTIGGGGDAP